MNYQDQLTLLTDILKNQQAQQYGTEDEFNQIQRLAQSLQGQEQLNETMQQTLTNITNYCSTRDCNNSQQIDQWIQSINESTIPYPHE
ncbi:hypothetical protein BKP45_11490 [Anaerobacillus alkalidiazotrophicus]|uniref:YtzH-like protein n=1 Tax=Anaerobacillus alkalidiazotrophicus TaxID=472963 RepID=A0A1S2M0H9_9BACI|nr:YtzH-like family protein [Anaerobacillus alkalidiazotrophicus]OIJ18201.1 hypothetical protein BKP45_17205 [Anaerobacillus alkalidiazotrophicus]OIJ19680.1 hypothetical protein BKP45_11490 [Anaerobacillus alkalidiazotrophicus]